MLSIFSSRSLKLELAQSGNTYTLIVFFCIAAKYCCPRTVSTHTPARTELLQGDGVGGEFDFSEGAFADGFGEEVVAYFFGLLWFVVSHWL